MHVSSGVLKGLQVDVPKQIRPTEGKVRQAIFNILSAVLPGARVLDACAGSGVLGLEALSRGAASVAFVDSDSTCIRAIRATLARVPADQVGEWAVYAGDVLKQVRALAQRGERFDLILCDPPYKDPVGKTALRLVGSCGILTRSGVLCLEHAASEQLPAAVDDLELMKQHRYGGTVLSFYKVAERPEAACQTEQPPASDRTP